MTIDLKAIRKRALMFAPGEHGYSQCIEDILSLLNEIGNLQRELLQASRLKNELTAIIDAKDAEIMRLRGIDGTRKGGE